MADELSQVRGQRDFGLLWRKIKGQNYNVFFVGTHGGIPDRNQLQQAGAPPIATVPNNCILFQTAELGDMTWGDLTSIYYQFLQNPMIELTTRVLMGEFGGLAEHITDDPNQYLLGYRKFKAYFPGETYANKILQGTRDEFSRQIDVNKIPNTFNTPLTRIRSNFLSVKKYVPSKNYYSAFADSAKNDYGGFGSAQLDWNLFTPGVLQSLIVNSILTNNPGTLNLIFFCSCSVIGAAQLATADYDVHGNTLGRSSFFSREGDIALAPKAFKSKLASKCYVYINSIKPDPIQYGNLIFHPDFSGERAGHIIGLATRKIASYWSDIKTSYSVPFRRDLAINNMYDAVSDALGIGPEDARRDGLVLYYRKSLSIPKKIGLLTKRYTKSTCLSANMSCAGYTYIDVYLDPDIQVRDLYTIEPHIENDSKYTVYYKEHANREEAQIFIQSLVGIGFRPLGIFNRNSRGALVGFADPYIQAVTRTTSTRSSALVDNRFSSPPLGIEFLSNPSRPHLASHLLSDININTIEIPDGTQHIRYIFRSNLGTKTGFITDPIARFEANRRGRIIAPNRRNLMIYGRTSGGYRKRITRKKIKSRSKKY